MQGALWRRLVGEVRSHASPGCRPRIAAFDAVGKSCDIPVVWGRQRPGFLVMSLYTYRVRSVETFRRRVMEYGANEVTEILDNDFGKPSFSFVAPEGSSWSSIEDDAVFA